MYKIITKIFVMELKKVLGRVVSHYQNALVEGQIIDCSLIAKKIIEFKIK